MAIRVKNGSQRLISEIWDLKRMNRPLLKLLFDVRNYCRDNFGKDVIITMIYRTDEEQNNIYRGTTRNGRLYDVKPWRSPHQFYHALDLRSFIFSKEEIQELVDYLNETYNDSNYYKFTAKCHDVGLGDHFHINYLKQT